MLLKDVIKRAIAILGLDGEVEVETESPKLKKLVDSANMIYSELTMEYIHLKTKETIKIEDGRVYYENFKHNVREVLSVRVNGTKIPFVMYPLYIETERDGLADIVYLYHTGTLGLEDEVTLPPQFNEYILAVGTVSEYYYRIGLTDEAIFYKNRYDTAVMNLSRRLRNAVMPARRLL